MVYRVLSFPMTRVKVDSWYSSVVLYIKFAEEIKRGRKNFVEAKVDILEHANVGFLGVARESQVVS